MVAPLKRSSVDKLTNIQILLLFGILLGMCILCSVCNEVWTRSRSKTDWYIGLESEKFSFFKVNYFLKYSFQIFRRTLCTIC